MVAPRLIAIAVDPCFLGARRDATWGAGEPQPASAAGNSVRINQRQSIAWAPLRNPILPVSRLASALRHHA